MSNAEWNTISFPALNIEFPVYSTAFTLFGVEIKWYGIMIGIGLLLAIVYCFRKMKAVGLESDRATDAVFFGFVGAIIGARLYYVVMSWDSYKDDLSKIFSVRDGGLAIYGGLIGALLVGLIAAKIRKVKILPLLDLTGMGFLIGQAVGRWGNFFNHECFGSNTSLPWGMTSPRIQASLQNNAYKILSETGVNVDPSLPVHPCFLYESLWCLAGFLLLHFYFKHRKFDGELFFIYVGWYGLGRFFIEGLRTDSLMVGHLRISQLVAALSVIAAVVIIIAMRLKIRSDGEYTFYKDTEESKVLIAEAERKNAEAEEKSREKKAARKAKKDNAVLDDKDKLVDDSDGNDDEDKSDSLKEAAVEEENNNG